MDNKQIKTFHRFLKEKGIYYIWMRNVRETPKIREYDDNFKTYNQYMKCVDGTYVVGGCFSFLYAPEEWRFWEDVHREWNDYMSDYKLRDND